MRWHLSAAAALIAAAIACNAVSPARAEAYPVCMAAAYDSGAPHCDFSNVDQCRATASGIGGSCFQNPEYTAAPAAIRNGPPKRRR